jgi:hypothetical protein
MSRGMKNHFPAAGRRLPSPDGALTPRDEQASSLPIFGRSAWFLHPDLQQNLVINGVAPISAVRGVAGARRENAPHAAE